MLVNKNISKNLFHIIFDELLFDAIICLDANLPQIEIFKKIPKIPLLAADGAAIKLFHIGIQSDYIIGDLDTFYSGTIPASLFNGKIIQIPEQETNDFEKVLKFALENYFENILIFGFHGGLLEHTLNNWSVLKKYSKLLNLCLYDEGRYGIPIDTSILLKVKNNEIVSLIPQPEATISTVNLEWELRNERLAIGYREGVRNIAKSDNIEIHIHSGELLLIFDERLPYAPKKIAK